MTEPRPADRERDREQHRLVALAGERAEPPRDVDVGRRQHPGVVELAQRPGGGGASRGVEQVAPGRARGRGPDPRSRAPHPAVEDVAQRRDQPGGGRQANTPRDTPSRTAAAPVIPRTNR